MFRFELEHCVAFVGVGAIQLGVFPKGVPAVCSCLNGKGRVFLSRDIF